MSRHSHSHQIAVVYQNGFVSILAPSTVKTGHPEKGKKVIWSPETHFYLEDPGTRCAAWHTSMDEILFGGATLQLYAGKEVNESITWGALWRTEFSSLLS